MPFAVVHAAEQVDDAVRLLLQGRQANEHRLGTFAPA
jgi:hypothetical protein